MNAAGGDVGGVTAAHRPRVHEAVRHQDEVLRSTLWTFVPPYNVPLHHEDVQLHVSLFLKLLPSRLPIHGRSVGRSGTIR